MTGAAMMCKRDDFINIGGFDEGYFYGYEDVDLCLLLQQKLKKDIVCANNLAMFHHRGLTRFNNPSKDFNLRRARNKEYLEKRFGYYVRRRHLSDLFDRELFWNSSPLRIGFAVTEASLDASAGDYFTALELAKNLVEEFSWEVFYLSQKDKNWYDMSSLDVIVVMRDDYNLTELKNCKPTLVKVMWIRNWFERLTMRHWVGDYDLIWASSQKAVQYLEEKLAKPVVLMPIATNNQGFQEAEFEPDFASDYCFTGSYWKSPREIIEFLEPDNLPFDFALYGYNWKTFDKFKKYYRGSLPYTEMSKVYASTKIVVDDANIATKEWGSVNSRVFDALSAGALVITNGKLGSDYVFDGLLPTYDSQESLEELLRYYLTNEPARLELVNKLKAIVNEKNTYKHRAYTAFESLKHKMSYTFRISIKIGVPRWEIVQEWGDYHFALAMKRAFERKGHSVRIDILPEWDTPKNYGDDVVIVLRGLSEYKPKPYNINFMWNISHPDKVSVHEYEHYDHIFIASLSYKEELSQKLQVPVETLLQCTDPDAFYPDTEGEEEVGEVLFVGNSRKVYRKIVKDALESGIKVDVYGTNWEYFISPDYLKGEHIPNKILRRYYTRAGVILNDHWETMSRYGFLSNRLFDAAASGATIISDPVSGLEEVFGDHVITYSSSQELAQLIPETLKLKETNQEKRQEFAQYIRENHSFDKRVEKMLEIIDKLHQQKMNDQAN
ncbi:glycosyltransferase [Arthrospira platensis SPKY2]